MYPDLTELKEGQLTRLLRSKVFCGREELLSFKTMLGHLRHSQHLKSQSLIRSFKRYLLDLGHHLTSKKLCMIFFHLPSPLFRMKSCESIVHLWLHKVYTLMSFSTYYILYVTSVTRGLSIKLKWKMFAKCFCEKSGSCSTTKSRLEILDLEPDPLENKHLESLRILLWSRAVYHPDESWEITFKLKGFKTGFTFTSVNRPANQQQRSEGLASFWVFLCTVMLTVICSWWGKCTSIHN